MDHVALSAAINACEKGWQWRCQHDDVLFLSSDEHQSYSPLKRAFKKHRVVTRMEKTHRVCMSWWSKQRYWSILQNTHSKKCPKNASKSFKMGCILNHLPAVSSWSLTIYSAWLGLSGAYMLCLFRLYLFVEGFPSLTCLSAPFSVQGLPCTYYVAWSMITSLRIIALFRHAKRCSWDAKTLVLCQGSEDLKWFWRYVIFLYFDVLCGEKILFWSVPMIGDVGWLRYVLLSKWIAIWDVIATISCKSLCYGAFWVSYVTIIAIANYIIWFIKQYQRHE